MPQKFYLHSAIPYVNAAPHIGHAQEFVYSDVIRRYQKLQGKDVLYLCGADENALKIVQAADAVGMDPQSFTDLHQQEFLDVAERLNVSFDVWQRGTDTLYHFPSSAKLWNLCMQNGDIYKKSYSGLYCVGCETFYTEIELDTKGECFEHPGKKLEKVSEENYFFRLSKYQRFLEELIEKGGLKIVPETRRNEALSFIRQGLEDFSVSRSVERARGWGVPVPGDDTQIMYVWFDALNIYQSGIGFGWDEEMYEKWWSADVYVIGKGILRFHAAYWPAILQSAGLKLPKTLFVHGYLTVDGQKMSKTLGNVVDPIAMIDKYGTDAVRYYLLREIPSYGDGDFSERRFVELYNADLANGLGNLVQRVANMAEKSGLKIKHHAQRENTLLVEVGDYIDQYRFDEALNHIWGKIAGLDRYINRKEPWKQDREDAKKTLHGLIISIEGLSSITEIAEALRPFLPDTSERILSIFSGGKIKAPDTPLFPRLS